MIATQVMYSVVELGEAGEPEAGAVCQVDSAVGDSDLPIGSIGRKRRGDRRPDVGRTADRINAKALAVLAPNCTVLSVPCRWSAGSSCETASPACIRVPALTVPDHRLPGLKPSYAIVALPVAAATSAIAPSASWCHRRRDIVL